MDHQNLELAIWLGVAILAIVCANIYLWRTRHRLNQAHQVRQDHCVTQIGFAATSDTESTSSVMAS